MELDPAPAVGPSPHDEPIMLPEKVARLAGFLKRARALQDRSAHPGPTELPHERQDRIRVHSGAASGRRCDHVEPPAGRVHHGHLYQIWLEDPRLTTGSFALVAQSGGRVRGDETPRAQPEMSGQGWRCAALGDVTSPFGLLETRIEADRRPSHLRRVTRYLRGWQLARVAISATG